MKTEPKRELEEIADYGKHYSAVTWCTNCGHRIYCYIPKGVRKKDCKPITCENCGCGVEV